MTKLEYKAQYRALRIALKLNPDYIPKTEVEYDLYKIWLKSRPYLPPMNQVFIGHYGKTFIQLVPCKNKLLDAIKKCY